MSALLKILCLGLLLTFAKVACAQQDDLNTQLMLATIKLSHDRSTATGFVLTRPNPKNSAETDYLLVTAAHVLENTPGEDTTLIFRKREAEWVYKKEPLKLLIRAAGKPLWTKHASEDVAVMVIVPPQGIELPPVPATLLASDEVLQQQQIHPGETLAYMGYPHRVEANEAGFPILRTGVIASYPLLPSAKNKTFLLSSNTFEGDSGSPVYLASNARVIEGQKPEKVRLILGLVSAQQFVDEEVKLLYGASKQRHRLGLALVVQAFAIRETIEQLP